MLFELNKILFTELVAVIFVVVPKTFFLLGFHIGIVEHVAGMFLAFFLVLKLGFEGIVLEGVVRRNVFLGDWTMRRV
jgi:ABC-type lipoprotein release transport system permease subunit